MTLGDLLDKVRRVLGGYDVVRHHTQGELSSIGVARTVHWFDPCGGSRMRGGGKARPD